MEPRRSSKKTGSYGEAPIGARSSQNTPGTGTWIRPQYKERVQSAPHGIPQSEEPQQHRRTQQTTTGRTNRGSQTPDTGAGSSPSYPSPTKQHSLPIQRYSGISQIGGSVGGSGDVQEVALAVLGGPAVGKSTFVHCALDLKASESPVSSKKVSLEGKISIVRLLEIGLEDVQVTAEQKVLWPEKLGDHNMPDLDGVLALYDVMDQTSIAPMPKLLSESIRILAGYPFKQQLLRLGSLEQFTFFLVLRDIFSLTRMQIIEALSKDAVPTVLVSAKCDNPFKSWEVDQDMVEEFCSSLQGLETFQTSASAPETHKRCISVILRNIMLERRGKEEEVEDEEEEVEDEEAPKVERPVRPRALTTTQHNAVLHPWYPSKGKSKHGRAASEMLNSVPRNLKEVAQSSLLPGWSAAAIPGLEHLGGRNSPQGSSNGLSGGWQSPASKPSPDATGDESVSTSHSQREQGAARSKIEFNVLVRSCPSELSNTPGTIEESLYSTSEDLVNTAGEPDCPEPTELDAQGNEDENVKEPGMSFEELVDRLLSQPMSKSDAKFATIFLCLYRKFAAPSTLISAIIRRFEELNDSNVPYLIRMASQSRYLNILKDWVSHYPGDFAHPMSRQIMTGFMQGLTTSQEYAIASKEISPHLDVVSEDDDTEWACSDNTRSRANTMESFLTMSSAQSTASTLNADSPTLTADSSTEDVVDHANIEKMPTSQPNRISETPSSASSIGRSERESTGSFHTLLNTVENAQRQAQLLTPISRNMLTKVQWHQLMEIPEENIARELTRIDWIMYSSIKPRDLIRHVSLQNDQKDKCKSLEHVNRMIHQFNHVAFWVTNMILLRDKPKHRAKALEKFMGVAWKLRYLNNYNSLGAVIAGVNGTAVHRLSQTRELIPAEMQRQFMRLEILMGTQKSHFAYRLAFGNTTSSRIPFLPLHRRDLVLAEQGNRTYMDGVEGERINWKKFEIMGEVIINIRKSQEVGYRKISRNEEIQRLVLDGRFCKDDDVLYERSLQIEAPGVGEITKKRFNWFQK